MWFVLASFAYAGDSATLTVESDVAFPVTQFADRRFTPLCDAPCSIEMPPDVRHRVRFGGNGVPPVLKTVRLDPGESRTVYVKPGKKGPRVAGAILTFAGLLAVTGGTVVNMIGGPQGGAGLILPASGVGLTLVGIPLTVAGSTKVKRKKP